MATATSHPRAMQCMEIRGGQGAVEDELATPGLEVWVWSRPFEQAEQGGDIHYVSTCGGGVITRLIVADVSGHGREVAGLAGSLRKLMARSINSKSQTALVRGLNREFAALGEMSRFATAVAGTYLANRRRLTLCNAGHPRPLLYRAASRRWSLLDHETAESRPGTDGNMPLGLDDETRYAQFSVELGVGDLVALYTDALIESADPSGALLGEEGLRDLASEAPTDSARGFGRALLDALDRRAGGRPAEDDLTLIVLRHRGEGPRRVSLAETLGVMAKLVGLRPI